MDFLDKIKKELMPDVSVLTGINKFISELNLEIRKQDIRAACVAGGSVAKGTFLKGDFDVDLFVKFDYSYKDKDISGILEKVLSKNKPERLHGSRDYFQLKKDGLSYEIVPVLDVMDPEKSMNVTDMSPMHVVWVKNHLLKGQEDEIRLTKKFCKCIGVYGAESFVSGFSGHVIDILIIKYGSFLGLLKAAAKWKPKVIIDTEDFYKNSQDLLFSMNTSKIEGPLIVVDPLLKSRNASSSLSYEKFALFRKKSAEFLKKPSEKYFSEEEIGVTNLKKRFKKDFCIMHMQAGIGKTDVVGSRILKSFKQLKSDLAHAGFELKESGWHWNRKSRVLFWFVVKDKNLPEVKIMEGPPILMKEACASFRKSHKKCIVKNGKMYAEIKNTIRGLEGNIQSILKDGFYKGKVKFKKIESF